jgi:hypothetical protein
MRRAVLEVGIGGRFLRRVWVAFWGDFSATGEVSMATYQNADTIVRILSAFASAHIQEINNNLQPLH